jgi:hypothetical protein
VEAFAADLERTRTVTDDARQRGGVHTGAGTERLVLPTLVFVGEDGAEHAVYGFKPYDEYRKAALAAGAASSGGEPPGVLDAIKRFGRLATKEVEEICGLATPVAGAQLWQLAADWKLRPVRVLTGYLWESA